jgi:hypothetical protein
MDATEEVKATVGGMRLEVGSGGRAVVGSQLPVDRCELREGSGEERATHKSEIRRKHECPMLKPAELLVHLCLDNKVVVFSVFLRVPPCSPWLRGEKKGVDS